MKNKDMVELVVACKSWQDAQQITDMLLEKKLAKTVEAMKVATNYVQRHTTRQTHTVKLIIQTSEPNVHAVKRCIRELRSQGGRPPYILHGALLSRLVAKWLRGATEVKSATLKR